MQRQQTSKALFTTALAMSLVAISMPVEAHDDSTADATCHRAGPHSVTVSGNTVFLDGCPDNYDGSSPPKIRFENDAGGRAAVTVEHWRSSTHLSTPFTECISPGGPFRLGTWSTGTFTPSTFPLSSGDFYRIKWYDDCDLTTTPEKTIAICQFNPLTC